jgi:hypothetical protein
LVFEDRRQNLLAMQAVRQPHENWKSLLLAGQIDCQLVEQFAQLLATIHARATQKRESLAAEYTAEYIRKFDSRLRICGWLRRAAFNTRLAGLGIAICGASKHLSSRIARATRSPKRDHHSPLRAG